MRNDEDAALRKRANKPQATKDVAPNASMEYLGAPAEKPIPLLRRVERLEQLLEEIGEAAIAAAEEAQDEDTRINKEQ
jgi:hypothetical protein